MLDRWRGLAVVLMVLDHALAATMAWSGTADLAEFTRLTLTRAAMPVFMVVSGDLADRHAPRPARLAQVAAAALVVNLLWAVLPVGTAPPDILLLWLAAMLVRRLWVAWPVPAVILGLIQTLYWPIPYNGYQTGLVVALLAVGVLAHRARAIPPLTLPPVLDRPVAAIGRHPLGWYLAHIVAIALVALVLVRTGTVAPVRPG